jgi:hypothetical protein
MKQIVGKLTESYLQKLSNDHQYFSPGELLESGFPQVLVSRIEIELKKNIRQSLNLPQTDWADTKPLSDLWNDFVSASEKEARLPAAYSRAVIEEALEGCIALSVQPRKTITELIFRDDTTIDLETLRKRTSVIVINRHLADALARYMERKGKKSLSRDQAETIVAAIDERLVADYHPLKWIELLNPLFLIAGSAVDPGLLSLFFREKGRTDVAARFDTLGKDVKDTEIIEVLSAAELQEEEVPAEEQQQLFNAQNETDVVPPSVDSGTEPADADQAVKKEEKRSDQAEEQEEMDESEEKALNEWFYAGEDDEDGEARLPWESADEDEEEEWPEFSIKNDNDEQHADEEEGITGIEGWSAKEEKAAETNKNQFIEDEPVDEPDPADKPESVAETTPGTDESDNDDKPLLNKFMFDDAVLEPSKADDDRQPKTIYDELRLVRNEEPEERTISLFDNFLDRDEEEEPVEESNTGLLKMSDQEPNEKMEEESEEFDESVFFEADEDDDDDNEVTFTNETSRHDTEGSFAGEEEDDDDTPMWQSFLQRSDAEEEPAFQFDEDYAESSEFFEQDEEPEEGPTPGFQLQNEDDELIHELSGWMGDDRKQYVVELFDGSEAAYEKAILDIMEFGNWKSASKYLEHEIFKRNQVDVYSEAAVDFTDRLHSYFLERKL